MDLHILSSGFSDASVIESTRTKPGFRKATRKMMLAAASIETALSEVPAQVKEAQDSFGLILSSGFGELEATAEFLKTWAEHNVARPLLFQNSLHNSTTGFAAIQFHFTGPVLTINHRGFGGEHALELADTLLAAKQCRICLVTTVETTLPEFASSPQVMEFEGATTLVLAAGDIVKDLGLTPKGRLIGLRFEDGNEVPDEPAAFSSFYENDVVYAIHREPRDVSEKESVVPKPGAGRTVLTWA